jgi:hypothetical protein
MTQFLGGGGIDADWISQRLNSAPAALTNFVPQGYAAYVQILHPFHDAAGRPVRWQVVAKHLNINTDDEPRWPTRLERAFSDQAHSGTGYDSPLPGPMDPVDLAIVAASLDTNESGKECICGFWEGWTELVVSSRGPWSTSSRKFPMTEPIDIGDKKYRLSERPLREFAGGKIRYVESPDLIWPRCRSWFLRSDVQCTSSFLAGTRSLISRLLAQPDLETIELAEDAEVF